jgi:hypothetical protein
MQKYQRYIYILFLSWAVADWFVLDINTMNLQKKRSLIMASFLYKRSFFNLEKPWPISH